MKYLREVLKTAALTAKREDYAEVNTLPNDYDFFKYQDLVNKNLNDIASHVVIDDYINKKGMDYRFEEDPSPIDELRDRKCDNITVGRIK
ncbi:MAG: hypothetical protein E6916_04085 [Clostridium cochlearium]|uniref:hypothetical protein n=1 Tax=Clostridium cochlearium TaxID=1494 RepID=UPI001671A7E6|nr:hypothetical protein [Clostridium cochlearium]MBU5268601.1 hypothetical protein [Clostridium cochlearium]MDU1442678.1 hypothetical protein [Clostridium cochlearium]